GGGNLRMLCLCRHRWHVPLTGCGLFCRRWLCGDSTLAAVIADTVNRRVIDHRRVVNIVNVGDIDVVHRSVVIELAVVPASAFVAMAEISVTVSDAAVEANLRPPIALIEKESVTTPTPVRRSPEIANLGNQYPCARNPVVVSVIIVIGPVAGGPDVPLAWAKRLRINR